jgi:hypothetical protein
MMASAQRVINIEKITLFFSCKSEQGESFMLKNRYLLFFAILFSAELLHSMNKIITQEIKGASKSSSKQPMFNYRVKKNSRNAFNVNGFTILLMKPK